MKWDDYFEVQYQVNHHFPLAGKNWRVVSKHQQFGNWPRYGNKGVAVRAAKAMFRKIERDVEKALLG